MLLNLIKNQSIEKTTVTIEYKEKDEFFLSIIGRIRMEAVFGTCIIKKMSDIKRCCIFVVPFAVITFICAVILQWITQLHVISTYVKFSGIFIICWILSILLFEIEHRIRGKNIPRNSENIKMEEILMNNKTKDLERMSFALASMFAIYWIYSCFLKQYFPIPDAFKTVIGLLILYVIVLAY